MKFLGAMILLHRKRIQIIHRLVCCFVRTKIIWLPYALRHVSKAVGVSQSELTKSFSKNMKINCLRQKIYKIELRSRLAMIQPGIYEHYKGSKYELIAIANHSETLEKMVVYKALYGDGELWVRPIPMWEELVDVNGEKVPRFRYIGE